MKANRSSFYSIFIISISILLPGLTQAVVVPYYAHGDVYTREGAPYFSLIEENQVENAGRVYLEAGNQWWCETPNCGVSISAGAVGGYGEVEADPVNGTLAARAGSMAYAAYGGYGRAYGYISQVFRVGSDGSLLPGDTVSLDAGMLLDGYIEYDSQAGMIGALVTVDHLANTMPYTDYMGNPLDYMPVTTFEDVLFWPEYLDQKLAAIQFFGNQPSNPISVADSINFTASVGDVLIVESMLYVSNELGYSDGLGYSWTDFSNTMSSSLTPLTPGATLEAVPVPASIYLFASGLIFLLLRRNKK
ncbi:MAG: PEP-CTERM sorting domain-containing protein [Gammaproteobacteria bacterium]|nr:PEP-CTERM sorting domain-containing protein [Gammaproteobacteria bacterium]